MNSDTIERQFRLARAIMNETEASCRLVIAQVNRIMHEHPECDIVDVTPLYTSIDLCGKIDEALKEYDIETAIRMIAELKEIVLMKEHK